MKLFLYLAIFGFIGFWFFSVLTSIENQHFIQDFCKEKFGRSSESVYTNESWYCTSNEVSYPIVCDGLASGFTFKNCYLEVNKNE